MDHVHPNTGSDSKLLQYKALSSLVDMPCGEVLVFFLVEFPAVFFHGHDRISTLVHVCVLSRVGLFVTPQTVACKAPLSIGFSR